MTDWTPAGASGAEPLDTERLDPDLPDPEHPVAGTGGLDLEAVERDLVGVEAALARLDAGTYWTDEITGERLPDALLEAHPTARRRA